MFTDCGWEYLFDVLGYSYFRKPQSQMEGEEKIFCDDQSRLEMLKRVIRGRIYPLIIIFLLIIIPQLTRVQFTASGRAASFIKGIFAALLVLYLVIFAQTAIGYQRLKKKLER